MIYDCKDTIIIIHDRNDTGQYYKTIDIYFIKARYKLKRTY